MEINTAKYGENIFTKYSFRQLKCVLTLNVKLYWSDWRACAMHWQGTFFLVNSWGRAISWQIYCEKNIHFGMTFILIDTFKV